MKPQKLMLWTIGLLLLVALAAALRIPFLRAVGDFLVIQDDLHPADILHVVSGPDYRTDYGIELVQQGYAKTIFFTGPWCDEVQDVHADRGKLRALNQGIPTAAIFTDATPITSTYAEALRLKVLIDQSAAPVHSVIVVSDPFHMRRAQWTYRRVLGKDIEIQMAPVPFEKTTFRRRWWEDRYSVIAVREEYTKYVYYLARYGLAWGPLSNWLATFDQE